MKRITLIGMAMLLVSCFGVLQLGSGTAFAASSTTAQHGKYQAAQQAQTQNRHAKTFTGVIYKEGNHYALLASGKLYQLSNQTLAKKYLNDQVKVSGKLGPNGNKIEVKNIQRSKPNY